MFCDGAFLYAPVDPKEANPKSQTVPCNRYGPKAQRVQARVPNEDDSNHALQYYELHDGSNIAKDV